MVIRRVRAKQRGSTGGRPKKIKPNEQTERERRDRERERDRRSSSAESGSDSQSSFNERDRQRNRRPLKPSLLSQHHHFNHNNSSASNFNPEDHKNNFGRNKPISLQPLKIDNNNRMPQSSNFMNNQNNQFQQQFLNQLTTTMRQNGNNSNNARNNNTNSVFSASSNSTETILPNNLEFNLSNIPQFIAGLGSNGLIQNVSNTNQNPTITMPKLIADNGLANAQNDDEEEDEIMEEIDGVKHEFMVRPIKSASAVKSTTLFFILIQCTL